MSKAIAGPFQYLFQPESEYVPDYISPFSSAAAHEAPLFYSLHFISTPCELSCIRMSSAAEVFLSAVTCSMGLACYIPDFPYECKGTAVVSNVLLLQTRLQLICSYIGDVHGE